MTPPAANGKAPVFRADIHMALVIDSDSYGEIGMVMDKIAKAVRRELAGLNARFDFTGFNTHPCKAIQMDRLAGGSEIEYAQAAPALTSSF